MKTIGHRGASGLAGDNDLEAIKLGLDCQVDYIEIDLQKTKDGRFLVHHDDEIYSSEQKFTIRKYTSQQLEDSFSDEPHRLLYLEQVVEFVKQNNPGTGLFLDCKNIAWATALTKMLAKIDSDGYSRKNFVVISFSFLGLRQFRRQNPDIETFYLYRNIPLIHLPLTLLGRFTGAGYYITKGKIALPINLIKRLGLKLMFYNVNDVPLVKRCEKLQIEYVETDKPNIIIPAIKNIKLKTTVTIET